MKKLQKRPYNKLKEYEIHCYGFDRKVESKAIVQASSEEDAEKKGKLFSKVAGVTFSHTKKV